MTAIALLLGMLAHPAGEEGPARLPDPLFPPAAAVSAWHAAGPAMVTRHLVPSDTARLVDDLGRSLTLTAPARRIVSLVPALTEILYAIGAGDRVVGRTRFDRHPPEAVRVPSVGDGIRPSLELVVALRPDLVILYAGTGNAGVLQELERAGLRVLAVRHDRLGDLQRNIRRLGRVTGCVGPAEALAREVSDGLARVAETTGRLPVRRVYYDVWADPPITVGAGSFLDSLLAVAGGRNVFGDLDAPSPQVSLEGIAVRRPDVVVWAVDRDASNGRRDPRDRQGWLAVEAIERGSVVRVDADLVHRLGPRVVEAAATLARAIHPDLELSDPTSGGRLEAGSDPALEEVAESGACEPS